MLYLAENLKALRKGRDKTQEEVAEILGVSAQSVSKWERGDTYPDITLLPSLANFYDTSVDALIGMEKINDAEAKTAVYIEGQRRMYKGDNEGAAAIYSDALKKYPTDESLMIELAIILSLGKDPGKLDQAKSLCQRILSGNPTERIKHSTRAALSYIYFKAGDKENATKLANDLPHIRVCRDSVLEELGKEADFDEIDAKLRFLTFRDNPEHDAVLIDFGLDMLTVCTEFNLIDRISQLRDEIKSDEIKSDKKKAAILPPIRIRDSLDLAPDQVRVRYFNNYLLDKSFDDAEDAANEIIAALRGFEID